MKQALETVYQALVAAFPVQFALTKISRAWPQIKPPLPSISFYLSSWQTPVKGCLSIGVALLIRAGDPIGCDEYSAVCAIALAGIGYALLDARDGAEEDTGCYLKQLDFKKETWSVWV